jgi:deoxyribose-phosphate aldolase
MTSMPPTPTGAELTARLDALGHLDDEVLRAEARAMMSTAATGRDAVDHAISLVDLTSLEATDTAERIRRLAARALTVDDGAAPRVAAVCVWPDLVGVAAHALAGSGVRAAAVAGAFPSARSPLAVRVAEVESAVAAGADEIDLVIDRAALGDGRFHDALTQLVALRRACGRATCKVILETGALPDADAIQRAAWTAMLGGADMLKTSTGKDGPGASPMAVLVLLRVARAFRIETGRDVGVKVSGGVRTADDALGYLAMADAVGGPGCTGPRHLRFGASSLLDALVAARHEGTAPT